MLASQKWSGKCFLSIFSYSLYKTVLIFSPWNVWFNPLVKLSGPMGMFLVIYLIRILNLHYWYFWFFVVGGCSIHCRGCLGQTLASTHQMIVVFPHPVMTSEMPLDIVNVPWRAKSHLLENYILFIF